MQAASFDPAATAHIQRTLVYGLIAAGKNQKALEKIAEFERGDASATAMPLERAYCLYKINQLDEALALIQSEVAAKDASVLSLESQVV